MSKQDPRHLRMADYTYELPDNRIASHPLPERDTSKLLVYKEGIIAEDTFRSLPNHIPEGSIVVFNTTKVVHARLRFQKPTGEVIELFCLEPHPKYPDITTAMSQEGEVLWQCLVGGAAKWKNNTVLHLSADGLRVAAKLISRNTNDFTIAFEWVPDHVSFAEVLKTVGKVPLPPYINREANNADSETYQTIFANKEGSVAAPTASLHFTPRVIDGLVKKGIQTADLTLHVGAGTFKPVKSDTPNEHEMHAEWIEVSRDTVLQLSGNLQKLVVAGGTTALRTLESLYWIGCKLHQHPATEHMDALNVSQWEAYDNEYWLKPEDAIKALLDWMNRTHRDKLVVKTSILIAPGYTFRIVKGLITNFHQPGSTLLLLVAAFIGPAWRHVYQYALEHHFRFLSYGDGSLLWREQL